MDSYAATDSGDGGAIALVLLLALSLYFLPTIVALLRRAPDRGTVVVLNLFLGWTFMGWVAALAIASRSRVEPIVIVPQPPVITQPSVMLPPGWYPAPGTPGVECYWDGQVWTSRTRRITSPPAPRA
ncbi:superinfection immunity protein [Geodermatophilus sp. SYSU D00758]